MERWSHPSTASHSHVSHAFLAPPRPVSWGATKSTDAVHVAESELDSRRSFVSGVGSGENIVEISNWPPVDPLSSSKRSSIRLSKSASSNWRMLGFSWKYCNCVGSGKKKPIAGVIEGPILKLDTSVLPIDFFSTYQGNIKPNQTALIALDGTTTYTYQDLNILSDLMAKYLKPTIEAELKSDHFKESLKDLDCELCVAVAIDASEKWVIVILSIWKLGLSYLPMRAEENPSLRVAKMIEVLTPVVLICSASNKVLEKAAHQRCRVIQFEELWNKVEAEKKSLQTAWTTDERENLLTIKALSEYRDNVDPSQRTSVVLHRFSGKGEVTATYIRNCSIWNRLHAEWRDFPYSTNEYIGMYSSVDSHEFTGQMLSPLLAGIPIVAMNMTDLYSFAEGVAKWKLQRLMVFPEHLRAIFTFLKLADGPDAELFNSVKNWFCTGGSVRRGLAISFFLQAPKSSQLINLYGCKEALSFVCYDKLKSLKEVKSGLYYEILPIGRPVINTRIYVLDEDSKVTGNSGLGEVFIAGLGITMSKARQKLASLPVPESKVVPNPNFTDDDDPMFSILLRTSDFGRLIYSDANKSKPCSCFMKDKVTLQFSGNEEGEAIVENYRINTNELIFHIKGLPTVKACHVMVYRPGTQSMAILAFVVVAHRQHITKEELHLHLRERVPRYMMPTLIFIPGIPVKNFKINNAQLVEIYQKERMTVMGLLHENLLAFKKDSPEMKAAKVLFRVLFHCCGVGEEWVATHLNWSLAELNIPFTSLPRILQELRRHGYYIDMKSFFTSKTPDQIWQLMMKNIPKDDIISQQIDGNTCGQFIAEVISSKHKGEIFKFFLTSNCGYTSTSSVFYFGLMKKRQVMQTIKDLWPLVVMKAYSIAVRDKSTKKVVAALLNADHDNKLTSKEWAKIAEHHPNKYYLEMLDDIDENLKISLTSSKVLQTLFFVVDPKLESCFKESVQVTSLLITKAIQEAKKAEFPAMYMPVFDYVYSNMIAEAFKFDIIESKQINTFEAKDGTKPFGLAPDNISATILHKVL